MYIQPRRISRSALAMGDDASDLEQALSQLDLPDVNAPTPSDSASGAGPTTTDTGQIDVGPSVVISTPYTVVGGICLPTSQDVLDQTKEMQRQINRALVGSQGGTSSGAGLIAIDGSIGTQTTGALSKLATVGAVSSGLLGSCSTIGGSVPGLTNSCKAYADSKGVAGSVSSPRPTATPSFVNAKTGKIQSQSAVASVTDAFKNLSSIEQIAVAAALGGVALLAFTGKKRSKKGRR